jgi:uncharacterized protein YkwD
VKAVATILLALSSLLPLAADRQTGTGISIEAEAEIWRSFNRLRTEFELPPVAANAGLDEWARQSSRARAMARNSAPATPAPPSLPEAAAAAGLYFTQTTTMELMLPTLDLTFLRESIMNESSRSGRRLWPEMDIGGAGVVKDDGARLHITLALLRSWAPLASSQIRNELIQRLDQAREKSGRKPLAWNKDYQAMAQEMAEGGAPGKTALARLKKAEKAASIAILTTEPGDPKSLPAKLLEAPFLWSGLGVWSGRLPEFPGGCYRLVYVYGTRLKDESHIIY